jgi:hypothetical protein
MGFTRLFAFFAFFTTLVGARTPHVGWSRGAPLLLTGFGDSTAPTEISDRALALQAFLRRATSGVIQLVICTGLNC